MAEVERLLVTHRHARQAIDASTSHYWALVRTGKIEVAGSGKAGRAVWASVRRYVDELVAGKATGKAA